MGATLKLVDYAMNGPASIIGGPFGSKLTTKDYVDTGVPVLRGSNLTGLKYIDESDHVYVSEEKVSRDLSSNTAKPGDIIFTQRGTLGQVAIIPENSDFSIYVISQSQMRMTVDTQKADADFLYYYFSSNLVVDQIKNLVSSSGVPHINLSILRKFDVPDLPCEVQKTIGTTLSRYDDLIANNRKRIGLLEESARMLFREWFVHLRFPGHERVKRVDGVPVGWSKLPLPEAVEINPRTRLPRDLDEIRYVPMSALSTTSMVVDLDQIETREKASGAKFQNGDTLLPRITPCLENGKTAFVNFLGEDELACGSTEFIVMRPGALSPEFVYCLCRTHDLRQLAINNMVGSSGRQRVQIGGFDDFKVLIPPPILAESFDSFARPAFEQIRNLVNQTHRLQSARDMLLPRLMSGEVAV